MVLDTDMIVHPDFLQRTIGHFYRRDSSGWVLKKRTAFIQTPQDFWNVPPSDPMVHCARFFYGPMLQGRDGTDATPCCGTGVVFSRTALISLGGQSYGSITEDYNTSMNLFAAGFSSMFLNERLVYGMAPESLVDVFQQRQRWAMGALQIIFKDNPLSKPGLTAVQSLLMFEAGAYHFLAISSLVLCIVPFLFIFADLPPLTAWRLWEFALAFGCFYFMNRLTIWVAARGIQGADIELWRGWQMWIWLAPNHVKSIWKVIKSETWVRKLTGSKEIAFKVTSKDATATSTTTGTNEEGEEATPLPLPPKRSLSALRKTLGVTWYFLLYYITFATAIFFTIIWGKFLLHIWTFCVFSKLKILVFRYLFLKIK
jgi:cellulose synthase (UDP-forming)